MSGDASLRWRVGDVTITRVEESVTPVPAAYLLPDVTLEQIDAQRPWISPFFSDDGEMLLSVHSFVIEAAGTTIVVDTCAGVHDGRPLPGDPTFLDRLSAEVVGGLDAVDAVVCTHLHFDHIGWNTVRDASGTWVPAFPNARYLITAAELDGFSERDEDDVAGTSLTPLVDAGVLDEVGLDHRITPEVRFLPTTGHTPGHVSVVIESGGDVALITGDATHSPIQLAHPELAAGRVDHDAVESTRTRRDLIARFVDTETLVLGTHFAPPTSGLLCSSDTGAARLDPPPR
ncbi:MBL fold metallo-hydrolase [Ilumatobacter sp.]|uniref:MBL fold metallo-hydrolase n=1 Tax=Ilumatobacter sp. TaxID=1967498 RepID=UPI003AF8540D